MADGKSGAAAKATQKPAGPKRSHKKKRAPETETGAPAKRERKTSPRAVTTASPTEATASNGKSAVSTAATATTSATDSAAPTTSAGADATAAKPAAVKNKFCLNCQKDLTRNIRITCAECHTQPPIELCVECFAVGIELGEHKKSHAYTVSDCLAFPVVRELQEVPVPASVHTSTSANAPAGAAASSSQPSTPAKTPGTAASGSTASTPAADVANAAWTADEELLLLEAIEMFGMGNWKDIAEHVVTKTDKKCEAHYMTAYLGHKDLMPRFLDDAVVDTEDKPSANSTVSTAPASEQPADGKPKPFNAAANAQALTDHTVVRAGPAVERNGPSQLAGYMPLRGDFDVEYDNEAEVILADMEFSEEDHPTERELKLKVIDIYNQKLTERERRKKFVVERGLLDYKLHQHTERKRPKEERELLAQVRAFARFQTPEEHDKFVDGLIAAMRLKKQILLLQEYRKNGVRTLAEAELYDAEKKKRELDQKIQSQRDSNSYIYESGRAALSGRDRANRWQSREQGGHGDEAGRDQDHPRTRGAASSATTAASVNAIAASFLIDGTPGCHLLTPKEKELCSKLKLLPKHYLVIKDALVRECYRLGYLTKKIAKETVQIDVNKTGQIYDFFVKCGWVKSENAAKTVAVASSPKVKSPKGKKRVGAAPPVDAQSTAPVIVSKDPAAVTPAKRTAGEMEAASSAASVELR